ncbi:MAG TPA: hypothetical protein P5230_02280 [Candidatus Magasanikbacteria bacterium]|nr:hypothetical protein [Candidatus Magasanikbacteria bacterium]
MNIFLALLAIILLFIMLGYGADLVVLNLRQIGNKLGLKVFFLGIVLGLFTSLPEMSVGINSIAEKIPEISAGTLFGGILVIIGLILGTSLMLHREIKTDGEFKSLLSLSFLLLLPILLSLDGILSIYDGFIMIGAYLLLIWFFYLKNKSPELPMLEIVDRQIVAKELFLMVAGFVLLVVSSGLIVRLTRYLLDIFHVSPFIIGLLVFSLGTNLPEITVSLKAWRKKSSELSVSNLMGSAAANVFILGVVCSLAPMNILLNKEYFLLALTFVIIITMFGIFYRTGKKMTAKEGACLSAVYFIFIFLQYSLLF